MFEPNGNNRETSLRPICIGFALVVMLVFIIYLPTLSFEFTNWDDPNYVQNNQAIQTPGWSGLKQVLTQSIPAHHGDYIPVTMLSYWVDYQFWGLQPIGYHLTNLLLHVVSAGLIFLLLKRLTMRPVESMMVTFLFALHPMNTEAVTWISERKSVMAMFWMLLSFHTFLSWQQNCKSHSYFFLSLLFYLLACLSKTAVVFFPLIVMTYQICIVKMRAPRSLLSTVPFFLISIFTGIGRLLGHYISGQMAWKPFENPWNQMLTIFEIFGDYLKTLMIPMNLNNSYPLETARSLFDPGVLFGLLSMIGMFILIAWSLRRYPLVCFGLAWYLAAWLPHSQIIAIPPALRADRYVYYSSSGLFLALVFGIEHWVIDTKLTSRHLRAAIFTIVFIVIGTLASITILRNYAWSDSISLWRDSIKKYYQNPLAHTNLGTAYFEKGKVDDTILEYKKALAFNPNYALAHTNLGIAYLKKGMLDEAIFEFRKTLIIKPNHIEAHTKLGTAYFEKGMLDEAILEFKKALTIIPDHVEAYYKLGSTLEVQGKLRDAISAYREVIHLKPDHHKAYNNLAWIYATSPNALIRNADEAIALATKACELTCFKKAEALDTLAAAYAEQGSFEKAMEYQHRAIELAPPQTKKELQKHLKLYRSGHPYRQQ